VHALILFLILAPIVGSSDFTHDPVLGGGGEGPAGGGGGGINGPGTRAEHVEFVRVRSDPTAMPKPKPLTVPPVKPPEPKPRVESPVIPAPPVSSSPVTTTPTGEGTGNAGTAGAGPGSGGGVGSGVGTGRGSSVGPGTGGGPGKDYPPTLRDLFIPPLPAPDRVKPYHLIAWFDVDEKGNARLIAFNPSKDGGYNRRLNDVLRSLRFRPGVHADGTPMRDTVDVHFIF
jgi:periplasmic protein TonB